MERFAVLIQNVNSAVRWAGDERKLGHAKALFSYSGLVCEL